MVFLPRLARHLGTDPGVALWLGALSPLALFSFVASGHNDALMVGLLVAGVQQRLHLAARRPHQDFIALLRLAQLLLRQQIEARPRSHVQAERKTALP